MAFFVAFTRMSVISTQHSSHFATCSQIGVRAALGTIGNRFWENDPRYSLGCAGIVLRKNVRLHVRGGRQLRVTQ